jgi:hypothetical protein
VVGSCAPCNETVGSIKGWELLERAKLIVIFQGDRWLGGAC